MAAVRITLSVPDELAARIKAAAGEGTVSGWVVKVIEEYFEEDAELERQFDEWLAADPPDEEARRWARDLIARVMDKPQPDEGAA